MFVAMNNFKVANAKEEEFERIWKTRESYLAGVQGFVRFALLRADGEGEYISHSTWESRDAFMAWTQSPAFAAGHRPCIYCRRDDANAFRAAWQTANQSGSVLAREIGDVLQGVAAGLDHLETGRAQLDHVAAGHLAVERRQAGDLLGPDHLGAGGVQASSSGAF